MWTAEAQRAAPAEGRPEADTDPCLGSIFGALDLANSNTITVTET